jgi:putative DNA primase/helicase
MTWRNHDDVAQQLAAAGLLVDAKRGIEVGTSHFVRCKVLDGGTEKRGWYKLYTVHLPDGSALIGGSFGINSGNDHGTQKVEWSRDDRKHLTPQQVEANRARAIADRKAADAEIERKQEAAAAKAARWWRKCNATGEVPYLIRKGFAPGRLYGARVSDAGNLVIPVQDARGKTWGLQVIYQDPKIKERKGRDKDFAPPGLKITANLFIIGSPAPGGVALLCEGFATGCTLHEATGMPVVVAYNAGNMLPAAKAIVAHYRGLRLMVCADDDYLQTCSECKTWTTITTPECTACGKPHRKRNAGIEDARTTALAVGGSVVSPIFPGDRPTTHKGPTDFNDLHTHPDGGLSMVARQVESSLSAAGWRTAPTARIRAPETGQGGGDLQRAPLRGLYALDEACERWTLLYGSDGAFFDAEDHCIVRKADVYALIPDHAARDWKLRPDRRVARFQDVGFDPTEKDERVKCNLWGGWPTAPKAGDCEILLDLLRHMCSLETNSQKAYDWALKWLAYPIQHHGAKMKSTLVFHGMQGAGKNLFFDQVAAIYGEYGGTVDQLAVESQFNDWASRKLFLVFDEVVARNELYFLKNRIKSLITGDVIRINPKNMSAWNERNHCNGVWLSNELHPCAVEVFDRRHFIIWTPPALSPGFYSQVAECLANGGRAALHHHLLNLDLGDFSEHSKPPMTDAKLRVQELSSGSIERFFRDWTCGDLAHPICACSSGQIFRAYTRYSVARGEKPRAQIHLSGHIATQPGWTLATKDVFDSAQYSGTPKRTRMVIPPENLLNMDGARDYRKRPDKKEAQWATDSYFAFQDSLGDSD